MPSHRGESFRREFSQLGDVRSLIPESVHIMALTATATKSTRRDIIKILRMIKPAIVSISPNRLRASDAENSSHYTRNNIIRAQECARALKRLSADTCMTSGNPPRNENLADVTRRIFPSSRMRTNNVCDG